MLSKLLSFLEKPLAVYKLARSADGSLFVYALSYSLLLGLAPFLIIAVIFIGNYVFSVDQIISLLGHYIPNGFLEPFISYIKITNFESLWALLTLLGASVWVASKSLHSFLLASSIRDGVEFNGIILRIVSLIYFLFLIFIIMVSGLLVSLINIPRTIVLPLVLLGFFLVFYWLLSFRQIKVKELLMGSVFSTIAIGLVGALFFTIVNQFFNYDTIYGPFASVMILLLSLNIISQIIYIGYLITYVYKADDAPIKRGLMGRITR